MLVNLAQGATKIAKKNKIEKIPQIKKETRSLLFKS